MTERKPTIILLATVVAPWLIGVAYLMPKVLLGLALLAFAVLWFGALADEFDRWIERKTGKGWPIRFY